MPGQRVRELIAPLGYAGGKTIVDDYLREVRLLFDPPRTFQRTIYRPGEICQFDLWEPKAEVAVGHGQTRRGWVVVACLGYSRAGTGALIFSKEIPELLFGIRRCLWSLGARPETLVWDRQSGLHAGGGRPTVDYAAFCGALKADWHFCDRGDPQANAVLESFHASLKKDLIHRRSWPTKAEARTAVFNYIEAFYNRRRRHSTLGMLSPADFETSTLKTDGASFAASRLASTNKIMFTSTSTAQAA